MKKKRHTPEKIIKKLRTTSEEQARVTASNPGPYLTKTVKNKFLFPRYARNHLL